MNIITFIRSLFVKGKESSGNSESNIQISDMPLSDTSETVLPAEDNDQIAIFTANAEDISSVSIEEKVKEPVNLGALANSKVVVENEKEKPTSESEDITDSLLDNKAFIKLCESNCNLIEKIDEFCDKEESKSAVKRLQYIKSKLKDGLVSAGASFIEGETTFNNIKHEAIDGSVLGINIDETIDSGICVEDRVFIRAKVILKKI